MSDFNQNNLWRLQRELWRSQVAGSPPIPEAETISRFQGWGVTPTIALTSGRLQLGGGAIIVPSIPIKGIAFYSGTTAYTPGTNQWFAMIDAITLEVLAKTVDDTTTAWAANARKQLLFATPYSPKDFRPVYLGIVVVGGTPPTLRGVSGYNSSPINEVPPFAAFSTTGLTDPASLGATAAAYTTDTGVPYAHWF